MIRYTSSFRNVPLPGRLLVLGETPCPGGADASPSARCRPAVERKAELSARRPAPLGQSGQKRAYSAFCEGGQGGRQGHVEKTPPRAACEVVRRPGFRVERGSSEPWNKWGVARRGAPFMPRKSLDALGAPQPERVGAGRRAKTATLPPSLTAASGPRQGRQRHLANTIKATAV